MCGIIGYSGHRPAVPLLIEGLHRLEYRGYDSSGVAFMQAGKLHVVRAAGRLSALEAKLAAEPSMFSTCGIGHTRWATHARPKNAMRTRTLRGAAPLPLCITASSRIFRNCGMS